MKDLPWIEYTTGMGLFCRICAVHDLLGVGERGGGGANSL